jgi:hypothetical protein
MARTYRVPLTVMRAVAFAIGSLVIALTVYTPRSPIVAASTELSRRWAPVGEVSSPSLSRRP